MSKKEQIDEVKEAGKMYREKTSLRGEIRKTWAFIKFLVGFLFGLAIAVLGGIAIYIAKFATDLPIDIPAIGRLALVVSGVCAVVDAIVIWWKIREEK